MKKNEGKVYGRNKQKEGIRQDGMIEEQQRKYGIKKLRRKEGEKEGSLCQSSVIVPSHQKYRCQKAFKCTLSGFRG